MSEILRSTKATPYLKTDYNGTFLDYNGKFQVGFEKFFHSHIRMMTAWAILK